VLLAQDPLKDVQDDGDTYNCKGIDATGAGTGGATGAGGACTTGAGGGGGGACTTGAGGGGGGACTTGGGGGATGVGAEAQRAALESAETGVQFVGLGGGYPAAPIPSIMTYLIPPFVTTSPTLYTLPLSYGAEPHRSAEGRGLQFVGLGGGYPAAPIPSFMI